MGPLSSAADNGTRGGEWGDSGPSPANEPSEGVDLAIVIVCHDDREDLGRCLESLFREPPATSFQVVVVDNASTDGSVETIAQRWPDILILENQANLGFAQAVNRGIRTTSSELLLLLNPDTQPGGKAIDLLAAELRADASAAAAGPRIVDGDGRPEISWWDHLGPLAEWRLRRLRHAWERGTPQAERRIASLMSHRRQVDWLTGACLMARRQAVLAAGLMDDTYFLYFDDVDLCAALRAGGGRILFLPAAEIVHLRGRSASRQPQTTARHYRASQLYFYRKHHRFWHPLLRLVLRLQGRLP